MSMGVRIYDTETVIEIARKIYEQFDVGSSCTIYGFVMWIDEKKLVPKGEMIWMQLEQLDKEEHIGTEDGKRGRKYKFKKDSIGGPIAHKIFSRDIKVVDSEPRHTIWRIQ